MRQKPYIGRARIAVFALLLLPAFSFPAAAQAPARNCVSLVQMEDLALVNDDTILVTLRGNTYKRVDLDQCAGLAARTDFAYTAAATELCDNAPLPVTQAPAACTIRKIADIGAAEATTIVYAETAKQAADRKVEQARPRKAVAFDPKAFDRFLGTYRIDLDVFVTVTRNGRRYYYRVTGDKAVEVFPESAAKFFAKSVPAQISFAPDSQGVPSSLTLHRNGELIVARRVDASVAKASEAALGLRFGTLASDPEREVLLRRYLAAEQVGEIPAEILSPPLLAYTTQQWPAIQETNRGLGKLEVLQFVGFHQDGADKYHARYEHGSMIWVVGSLTTDRKLIALTSAPVKATGCPDVCRCGETTISAEDPWKALALVAEGEEIQIDTKPRFSSNIERGGEGIPPRPGDDTAPAAFSAPFIPIVDDAPAEAVLGKIGKEPIFRIGSAYTSGLVKRPGPFLIVKNNSGQHGAPKAVVDVRYRVCDRSKVTILPLESGRPNTKP